MPVEARDALAASGVEASPGCFDTVNDSFIST
jgi:hypothetical protein